MRHLFVDTSAWDAIANKGDKNHNLALHTDNTARQSVLSELKKAQIRHQELGLNMTHHGSL